LLIRLPAATCDHLREFAGRSQYAPMTVDLLTQSIILSSGETIAFQIDAVDRHNLVHGLDDIARTLRHANALSAFEARP
jgi:3-isopropylmalate/(R)-2-methylmalate dehydratase small subunit